MKRVLLTGAGGGVGVHFLAHIFHNTDWEIVAIDSFRHKGYYDRITRICRNHKDWLPRLTVIPHDLVAPFTERELKKMGKIDYILNLASLSDVQYSIDDPITTIRTNVDLMLVMLELSLELDPEVFVQFSTDEVYGPADKDSSGHKEWEPMIPSNPYSASKAAQESICIAYWRTYGVPLVITNTMNNFGEMQAPSKFPAMIQKQLEKKEKVTIHAAADGQVGTRYYLHSRNAADAVLFILQNTKPYMHKPGFIDKPDRYNIVGDKKISNLELAHIIADLMGVEKFGYTMENFHDKNPGHDLHYGLDGSKLKKLGWKSPKGFEESMKNTIDWQQRNKEWLE